MASRSVFVADRREDVLRFADVGLRRHYARLVTLGRAPDVRPTIEEMVRVQDVHMGTVEEVIASLRTDRVLDRATELAVQVHSVDPPHPFVLRSIELVAQGVAPAFGWRPAAESATRRVA